MSVGAVLPRIGDQQDSSVSSSSSVVVFERSFEIFSVISSVFMFARLKTVQEEW